METLYRLLNRISNWKTLLVLIAAYVVFPAYILKNAETKINELTGKPIGPIDLTFGFDPKRTLQMVADYGDEARAYYATGEMTMDVIYPIVYAFLFGVILTLLFRNKPYRPFHYINVLPFLAMLFDFFENTFIVLLLYRYPEQSMVLATFCEIFKLLKWLTLIPIVVAMVYGLAKMSWSNKKS
jgi:hypothetical protein